MSAITKKYVVYDLPTKRWIRTNTATEEVAFSKIAVGGEGGPTLSALSGNFSIGNVKIADVGTPTAATDVANKSYVDSAISTITGGDFKNSVRVATAAALPAYTYNNGTNGVGATLTANTNGTINSTGIDGVTDLVVGNRVLVKNEGVATILNSAVNVTTDVISYTNHGLANGDPIIIGAFGTQILPIINAGSGTLASNPISTVTNSNLITITTSANHGLIAGDTVVIAGVSGSVGGIPASEINVGAQVATVTSNTLTFRTTTHATSTTTGGGTAGVWYKGGFIELGKIFYATSVVSNVSFQIAANSDQSGILDFVYSPPNYSFVIAKGGADKFSAANGIYEVTAVGDGSNPWVLTRATDADTQTKLTPNSVVFVEEGLNNNDFQFNLMHNGTTTIGTTPLVFGAVSRRIQDNIDMGTKAITTSKIDGKIILAPNSKGALQASFGGDVRGPQATDWQRARVANSQVASGTWSTIGGGANGTASGEASVIAGGMSNSATGSRTAVLGGSSNTASGANSAVGGGYTNVASTDYSIVGGGANNTVNTGRYSGVFCGSTNSNSGSYSTVVGGWLNNIASSASTIGTSSILGGYSNVISPVTYTQSVIDSSDFFYESQTIIGQTFTVSEPISLGALTVAIQKSGASTGTIVAYVYNTVSGFPSGSPIATSATISTDSLTSNYNTTKTTFTFASPAALVANTTYAFGLKLSEDQANIVGFGYGSSNPYPNGNVVYSNTNGSSWASYESNDMYFVLTAQLLSGVVLGGRYNTVNHTRGIAVGGGSKTSADSDFVVGNGTALASSTDYVHFRVAGDNSDLHIGRMTNQSSVSGANNALKLHTVNASNQSNYIGLKAKTDLTTSTNYVLPADGTSSQVLSTDGAGNLSWINTLTGVSITSADTNDVVQFNGTNWVDKTVTEMLQTTGSTASDVRLNNADAGKATLQVEGGNSSGEHSLYVTMTNTSSPANSVYVAHNGTGVAVNISSPLDGVGMLVDAANAYSIKSYNNSSSSATMYLKNSNMSTNPIMELVNNEGSSIKVIVPNTGLSNWSLTLPATDGALNQALITDGAGVTSWDNVALATTSSFATGSIPFAGNDGKLTENTSSFNYDSGNTTLKVQDTIEILGATSGSVKLKSPASGGAMTYTLPATYALDTNYNGTMKVASDGTMYLDYAANYTKTYENNEGADIVAGAIAYVDEASSTNKVKLVNASDTFLNPHVTFVIALNTVTNGNNESFWIDGMTIAGNYSSGKLVGGFLLANLPLTTNCLTTTSGNTGVVLSLPNGHAFTATGSTITLTGLTDTGGILAADLNGDRLITSITSNTVTFTAGTAATSSTSGGGSVGTWNGHRLIHKKPVYLSKTDGKIIQDVSAFVAGDHIVRIGYSLDEYTLKLDPEYIIQL